MPLPSREWYALHSCSLRHYMKTNDSGPAKLMDAADAVKEQGSPDNSQKQCYCRGLYYTNLLQEIDQLGEVVWLLFI